MLIIIMGIDFVELERAKGKAEKGLVVLCRLGRI